MKSIVTGLTAIVLFATAVASASFPPSGRYSGTTSQQLAVTWAVHGHELLDFRIVANDSCGQRAPISVHRIPIRSDGRFHASLAVSNVARMSVTGRFSARSARGTFSSTQDKCEIGPITFRARRR